VGSLPAALGVEPTPELRTNVELVCAESALFAGATQRAGIKGSFGALLRSRGPRSGRFCVMPNIKQQKKRVRTSARERLENLRYRSSVKTLTKRLETAVAEGDKERAAAEHRELVRAIDKATSRRALHRNTAARKKSQAERLLSGSGS
jgi:small subunit ribosomal protein S20